MNFVAGSPEIQAFLALPGVAQVAGPLNAAMLAASSQRLRAFIQQQLDAMWSRLAAFEKELGRHLEEIPDAKLEVLAQSPDFVHCLSVTAERVVHARREAKIRMFARLLAQGATDAAPVSYSDQYEELLAILDELSLREFRALMILRHHEESRPRLSGSTPTSELNRINTFWFEFLADLREQIGLEAGETDGFLIRLSRSGLFGLLSVGLGTGSLRGPGMVAGAKGILTPQFRRLESAIGDDPEMAL
jgi:DNA-binding MarR family transcriptional regulator